MFIVFIKYVLNAILTNSSLNVTHICKRMHSIYSVFKNPKQTVYKPKIPMTNKMIYRNTNSYMLIPLLSIEQIIPTLWNSKDSICIIMFDNNVQSALEISASPRPLYHLDQ